MDDRQGDAFSPSLTDDGVPGGMWPAVAPEGPANSGARADATAARLGTVGPARRERPTHCRPVVGERG